MRTCQSCGRESPDDRDFCECGEYLRWEPTGFMQAITPEAAASDATRGDDAEAPPPEPPEPPAVTPHQPDPLHAGAGNGSSRTDGDQLTGAAPPPPPLPAVPPARAVGKTQVRGAVPTPPPAAPAEEPDAALISLRLPDEDAAKDQPLALGVHPGQRARVLALVRNQSGIVDNYQLSVQGLPDDWWTVLPDTVYLVPFGSGGSYEQEVEIQLHPPRTPEAEARIWELQVVAHSKAHERTAAIAPLSLGIQPFSEHAAKVKPERASGRRRAEFNVSVKNKANAPTTVAFAASEPDDACRFSFAPRSLELEPGETAETTMAVRPPKQIWIGRAHERRLEVAVKTGAEAAALAAESATSDQLDEFETGEGPGGKRSGKGMPGVHAPRVDKPQVHKPDVQLGPGGVQVRGPQVRGPQVRGPQMKALNLSLNRLKLPGQAPPPITGPLAPTQAVFRQQPWLPWWTPLLLLLALALLLFLLLFLPKSTVVPEVVGQQSAFAAEERLSKVDLRLAAQTKEKVDPKAEPGTVIGQTPAAGEKVEKESEVAILVAVGDDKLAVPDVTGKSTTDAEKLLREAGLSLGQVTPQPPDPEGKVESQIPAAKEIVKSGAPVDVFLVDPKAKAKAKRDDKQGGGAGAGGSGGGDAAEIIIPAIDGATPDAYAQKIGDDGLVPQVGKAFDESKKGTLFRVEPEPGTKAKAGDQVKLLVSAGFPQLAFDDDKDILLINGADGKKLDPVADGSQIEHDPAWSPDGGAIAFTSEGRILLANREKPDEAPVTLSAEGEEFSDLAWAPTGDANVLAMSKRLSPTSSDLCLGALSGTGIEIKCKQEPAVQITRKINWAPDGKSLLAFAVKDATTFGVVRWKTKKPFSADPDDWSKFQFETDISRPGRGALDAAISPDGKRMAVISIGQNRRPELYLAKPNDFLLTDAKRLGVIACKVIWRPDGRQLVVVQSDDCFGSATGDLVRLPIDDPRLAQRSLKLGGDNPVFQPLTTE